MLAPQSLEQQPSESSETWSNRLVRDLAGRHKTGNRPPVGWYLQELPSLESSPEVVLDLILAEWDLRRQAGEDFNLEQYLRNYPQLASEIAQLWEAERPAEDPWPDWYTGKASLPANFAGYRLERELGGGGQARVFVARRLDREQPVALKVPRLQTGHTGEDADHRRVTRLRFLREAHRMEKLHHRGLCPVLQVGECEGLPFFTMPFYPAGTLADERKKGTITPQRVARLVANTARVLQYVHDQGVLHRDLKPSNLLLDVSGSLVVGDLGMAKDLLHDERLTSTGHILGTLAYLSPEQAAGRKLTPASDQFSLGVVLYELLAGERPFGGTDVDLLQAITQAEPVALETRVPGVSPALAWICRKAMSRLPEDRYPSMNHLAADLERFLAGTWQSPEATTPYKRPTERRRVVILCGSILGVAGCLLLSVALRDRLWGNRQEPAPKERSIVTTRTPLGMKKHLEQLHEDLAGLPFEQRRRARYLSLLAVHDNPYIRDEEYEEYRPALIRLLSRLGKGDRREVKLLPVGTGGAWLRLDLRELDWHPEGEWQRVVHADPYRVRLDGSTVEASMRKVYLQVFHLTAMHPAFDSPWVRGDWLLAAGSRAPLFDVILTGAEQPRNVAPFDLDGDDVLARRVRCYDQERIDAAVVAAELRLGTSQELSRLCEALDQTKWGDPVSRTDWEKSVFGIWVKRLKLGTTVPAGRK